MPRAKIYANSTERQRAHRRRMAAKRDVTNPGHLGDLMERLAFIRDSAGSISRDNLAHWKGWRGWTELHCHALQDDLDRVVEMLDALIRSDSRRFDPEFQAWRARRH